MQQQPSPAVIQQYRGLLTDCQKLRAKISELELDRTEHLLVEETLKPLDPTRRAYRLVGECLVERTVQEVLPSVTVNRENVSVPVEVTLWCGDLLSRLWM
jgi:prefoldin subunit 2